MEKLRLYIPVDNSFVTQEFGMNKKYYQENYGIDGHNGLDYYAPHGTPVYAATDGVAYPQIDSASGNGVVIRTNKQFSDVNANIAGKIGMLIDSAETLNRGAHTYTAGHGA